jgi:hypothetical protein
VGNPTADRRSDACLHEDTTGGVKACGMTYVYSEHSLVTTGAWHHWAGTYDGRTVKTYVAGRNRYGVQVVHLNPLGLFLYTSVPCIWRTLEYSECLPTLLNPLAERACFPQVRRRRAQGDGRHQPARRHRLPAGQ